MRPRKLLTKATLSALAEQVNSGVPLSRAMRAIPELETKISRPSVRKLVEAFNEGLHDSLFPSWLEYDGQESDREYIGTFPHGAWK